MITLERFYIEEPGFVVKSKSFFFKEYFSYLKEAAEETSLSALEDTEGDQVDGQDKETLNTDDVRGQEGELLLPTQFL